MPQQPHPATLHSCRCRFQHSRYPALYNQVHKGSTQKERERSFPGRNSSRNCAGSRPCHLWIFGREKPLSRTSLKSFPEDKRKATRTSHPKRERQTRAQTHPGSDPPESPQFPKAYCCSTAHPRTHWNTSSTLESPILTA